MGIRETYRNYRLKTMYAVLAGFAVVLALSGVTAAWWRYRPREEFDLMRLVSMDRKAYEQQGMTDWTAEGKVGYRLTYRETDGKLLRARVTGSREVLEKLTAELAERSPYGIGGTDGQRYVLVRSGLVILRDDVIEYRTQTEF